MTKKVYKHKENALNVTIYSLKGESISKRAQEEIEEQLTMLALKHGLVSSVANT